MKATSRREFLKSSLVAGAGLALPRPGLRAAATKSPPSDMVRLAVIGLGGTDVVGGVGGRGHQLIVRLRGVPGARITTLCDVDRSFLEREAKPFRDRGESVKLEKDLRRVLEDKEVDAVVIALPNHWHALATVWACQAGKDVYVEKPFSYDLWEGRQMVAAARKYGRIVQVGTQNRSGALLRKTFADLRGGRLGKIRAAHAIVYRAREGIGRVNSPTPVPAGVDYDLWCGPAPKVPLRRKQLHYEWHWFWDTGNGEIGNNGVHMMDLCRWALGQEGPPARVMSIGGRFGFNDAAETPNTQLALLDYGATPLICEVRNLRGPAPQGIGTFRGRGSGLVIDCEGGYFAGTSAGGALFDRQGKKIQDVTDPQTAAEMETAHLGNFLAAVRSRQPTGLAADAVTGHVSTVGAHLANLSHRIGAACRPDAIRERTRRYPQLDDAFARCAEYLRGAGVDPAATPLVLGPWLDYDARADRCTGEFAGEANRYLKREYRAPFTVPELA